MKIFNTSLTETNPLSYDENNLEMIKIVNNSKSFLQLINNDGLNSTVLLYYSFYNTKNGGTKSLRLFINNIVFGVFQILASIFSFNARRPRYDWKLDNIVFILVIYLLIIYYF